MVCWWIQRFVQSPRSDNRHIQSMCKKRSPPPFGIDHWSVTAAKPIQEVDTPHSRVVLGDNIRHSYLLCASFRSSGCSLQRLMGEMIAGNCYDRIVMPTNHIDIHVHFTITGKVKGAPFLTPKLSISLQVLYGTASAVSTNSAGRFDAICPKSSQQRIARKKLSKKSWCFSRSDLSFTTSSML